MRRGSESSTEDRRTAAGLHRMLLAWFDAVKRDLPWRRDRDPYRVWISESMLQQTRVETVVGYYDRFLARFPDLEALADASEADVLPLWSGLGYYRRARALLATARAIRERHGGEFPPERELLLALPGIGPYTAGAVASIAFDRPEPLVDGNVARVFCRLFGLEGDPSSPAVRRELWARAGALVPRDGRAGDWNQALMELGATVCTARKPRCAECPIASTCVARASGRVGELPSTRARPEPVPVELEILLVVRGERWLLEQRPSAGRMSELWQLPTIEVRASGARHAPLFPERWPSPGAPGSELRAGALLGELRHTITRHRIRARVRAGEIGRCPRPRRPFAFFAEDDLGGLALTGMARKVVRRWGRRGSGSRSGD